jgi:hypothetical protein
MKLQKNVIKMFLFLAYCGAGVSLYGAYKSYENTSYLDVSEPKNVFHSGECFVFDTLNKESWQKDEAPLIYIVIERGNERSLTWAAYEHYYNAITTDHHNGMMERYASKIKCPARFQEISYILRM